MLAEGRAVIVNGIFASQRKVKVGDTLTLETPSGQVDYIIAGVGLDYLNAKLATGYISQANMEADFNIVNDMLIMANQAEDYDRTTTQAGLNETGQ